MGGAVSLGGCVGAIPGMATPSIVRFIAAGAKAAGAGAGAGACAGGGAWAVGSLFLPLFGLANTAQQLPVAASDIGALPELIPADWLTAPGGPNGPGGAGAGAPCGGPGNCGMGCRTAWSTVWAPTLTGDDEGAWGTCTCTCGWVAPHRPQNLTPSASGCPHDTQSVCPIPIPALALSAGIISTSETGARGVWRKWPGL